MSGHELPVPVNRKFFTPGVFFLLLLAGIMACVAVYRFIFGLGAATNLNQQYPWGLWIFSFLQRKFLRLWFYL